MNVSQEWRELDEGTHLSLSASLFVVGYSGQERTERKNNFAGTSVGIIWVVASLNHDNTLLLRLATTEKPQSHEWWMFSAPLFTVSQNSSLHWNPFHNYFADNTDLPFLVDSLCTRHDKVSSYVLPCYRGPTTLSRRIIVLLKAPVRRILLWFQLIVPRVARSCHTIKRFLPHDCLVWKLR